MVLQRGRFHIKMNMLASALTKTSMLSTSLLVLLGLVSLMSGQLHDLDGPSPVPISQRKEPIEAFKALGRPGDRASVSTFADNIWASKLAEYYHGCSSPSDSFARSVAKFHSTGHILIQTSGGLNQQRTGIIDAVVVARILNATLVVPRLDHKSFWKDSSNFSDIFNVDWFIATLAVDVPIVKELPSRLEISDEERIYSTRVPRKCKPEYFRGKVLPLLQKKKAIRLTKFDYRLSNRLEEDLQKLRCRVNYNALRFTVAIKAMGETLVRRLRQKTGRYIALHLRFEPDMLAFSGCYYGGGEVERRELGLIRKRWKSLHQRNPDRERRNGKCPLTPEEVGLMLRALGFGSDSYLYVASGEVYGGDRTLAPLKALFPNFYTKDSLATKEELQPFADYSSRMAAIDYIVCDESDVFVTNNNGNMARILAGRRRYFGHKRTIRPNAKRLGALFLAKPNMTWGDFASKLHAAQKGFMGEPNELRPGSGHFFENPDVCICESPKAKEKLGKVYKDVQDEEQHDYAFSEPDDEEDNDQDGESDQEEDIGLPQEVIEKGNRAEDTETEDIPWLSD